jgi:hypothetical protein
VDTSFIRPQAPFSGAVAREQASLHRLVLHLTLFYIQFVIYLLISNPYYLENHFVLFLFLFLLCCLDGVHQPPRGRTGETVEELEKSLRDYASPRCEDIKVQESDSKLEATKYEIKSKIIEMAAATPFEGMATENPYKHIRHFMTLCNTVRQEGVPDEWFKWNLFPYSLAGEAKTWYSFASFEVEGNWNKLTKKFCKKFFPISKVQHLRRKVITFMQGEEEGIDQAWNRFNELIE